MRPVQTSFVEQFNCPKGGDCSETLVCKGFSDASIMTANPKQAAFVAGLFNIKLIKALLAAYHFSFLCRLRISGFALLFLQPSVLLRPYSIRLR
jgi:hypothetical protein